MQGNGSECGEPDSLNHRILHCKNIEESVREIKRILGLLLGRDIEEKQITCMSFKHRDRRRLQILLWLVVRTFFELFYVDKISPSELKDVIIKDLRYNLKMKIVVGSIPEMIYLKNMLDK